LTILAAVPAITGTAGRVVAGGFVFVAVALALYAIASFLVPDGPTMASMISPYAEREETAPDEPNGMHLAETTILQHAVKATAKLAGGRGLFARIDHLLSEGDAPVKAAEAFFFANAAALIAAVLAWVTFGSLALAAITLVSALTIPPVVLKVRIARRRRKFLAQLPDTLNLLAGSLRAGYSLLQAVETVAIEMRDPMGKELGIVLTETRLGRPLEDALEESAERMASPDFDWAVMAINIQREVGGNLAELLSTVAETMVARNRLRREVRALTAEGRVTAAILGALPLVIGAALYVLNPAYMQVMFDRSIGKIVLAGSGLWAIVGFFWMKKIITVNA
jgi:tight adherence protein B